MKFSVQSSELLSSISKVISVLQTRSSLPILANLYLKLNDNTLEILGTDLEVYIIIKLEVNGKRNGEATIPGKKFFDIIQNLGNRELELECNQQHRLSIKSSEGKWNITGEDPNEFPMPSEMNETIEFEISSHDLNRFLNKSVHAASTDELRRSMNGIYLELEKDKIVVVATDGHRLVRIIKTNFDFEDQKNTILIPIKACTLMTRLFKGEDNTVKCSISDGTLKAECENTTLISRLIDDTFPNYESVIPLDNEKRLKVNKVKLVEAVKRSIIMSDQITNRTTLVINENEMKVKSSNNEMGTDSEEKIECSFISQEEFEISYNGKYLLDALLHFDGENILFDFSSPLKASILRPSENEENEDLMMLVMPVRNN